MLDILREERCGRPLYLLLLFLLIAFSFAAKPIERFLAANADRAMERIYPSPPSLPTELPKSFADSVGKSMNARTGKQDEAAFRDATRRFYENLPDTLRKAEEAQNTRTTIDLINMALGLLLSAATVGVTVWLVFGRVNDIGWDSGWGIAFLAPWLVLNLYGAGMTDEFYAMLQRGFLLGLLLLGLVPPAVAGREAEPSPPEPLPRTAPPAGQVPAQSFGRRRPRGHGAA